MNGNVGSKMEYMCTSGNILAKNMASLSPMRLEPARKATQSSHPNPLIENYEKQNGRGYVDESMCSPYQSLLFCWDYTRKKIREPTRTNPRTSLIKEPIMRIVHRLIVGSLVHRLGSKERCQKRDLWMMSALEESRGINLAWVIVEHLCKHAPGLKEYSLIYGGSTSLPPPPRVAREQRQELSGLNSSWGDWNACLNEIGRGNVWKSIHRGVHYGAVGDDYFAGSMPSFRGTSIVPSTGYEVGGSSRAIQDDDDALMSESEGKLVHLEQPLTPRPDPIASQAARNAYDASFDVQNEVACLMLGSMSPELQKALKNYRAYDMIQELKTMFKEQAKQELFKTVKGQSVSSYLLKMKSYLDTLERLGYAMPNELGTLAELHATLKLHEKGIPKKAKTPAVLAIREERQSGNGLYLPPLQGGWLLEEYCPSYHAELKKKKNASVVSTLGLRESKKLKHGALSLYMRNGMRAAIEAIRSFDLILPSGLIIVLDNFHFTPSVTRGVFSISRLVDKSYIHTFMNYASESHRLLEMSRSDKVLEIIQEEDTHPFENTSKEHNEVAPIEIEPQNVRVPIRRSARIPQVPDRCGHHTAVKTILKYLRNTKDMVLVYEAKPEDELKVSYYDDISFQTDKDDTKSQMEYVFVLNGGAVDWKSAKQSTTAMFSIEAEYIASTEASIEGVWMTKFIDGLGGFMPSNKKDIEMLCDNEPALAIARNPKILKGARHFQRKYHYIREVIQEGEIICKKVHTYENVADSFTKPMPLNKH
nr:hypothetical protein [Tanacetum cinerariifolium]